MRKICTASLLGALACLLLTPASRAAYDPLQGGTTKLTLEGSFASFLAKNQVKLKASRGAMRKGSTFTLPVASGNLDPTTGKGEIDQVGTLALEGKRGKVPLREITVKTKHSPLVAKVGGSQLKVATAAAISSKRAGFGSAFSARRLKLSAKAATRLNKKLRPMVPFQAGQMLGTLSSKPLPKLVTIQDTGRASLVFDPAFVAKLESRFVSLNPIFPAEHVGPTFSFPIAVGGAIAPDASEGALRTSGTVELLQLGGGQVFWQEPWADLGAKVDRAEVDLEPTPTFPGKLGRVGVFDLIPGAVSADAKVRTISESGISLSLQASAASDLNNAFAEGKAFFDAGEAVGALSFTAQGQ
jgi:hypothetical protein